MYTRRTPTRTTPSGRALPSAGMPDQLSMNLDARLPRLPASLLPMLARTVLEPFDSSAHLFEPNWGGVRALAFVEDDGSGRPMLDRLLDEQGRNLSGLIPELAGIAALVAAESVVLDGEIVVVDHLGRGDRAALDARLRGEPGPTVAFLAFDLLYRDGRPLLAEPLERRREILRRLLRPGDEAIAVPAIAGEGRALHDAVEEAGIAGVTARVRRSPYLPGVRSRMWAFVPRGAHGASRSLTRDQAAGIPDVAGPARAPVLALIRRLPLDDADA